MKNLFLSTFLILVVFFAKAQDKEELQLTTYYSHDSFDLSKRYQDEIREAFFSTIGGEFEVKVVGYTDNKGTREYNLRLSMVRARLVEEYIKTLPVIDIISINSTGRGEIDPLEGVSENKSPKNRKVDIFITYKELQGQDKKDFLVRISDVDKKEFKQSTKLNEDYKSLTSIKPHAQEKSPKKVEYSEDLDLDDIKEGDAIIFPDINFKPDRAKILRSSKGNIDFLYEVMKDNSSLEVEIQGHVCCGATNSEEEDTYVLYLSKLRAKEVHDQLEERGIEDNRMTFEGYGFEQPLINPEKTAADEIQNRRVEVKITNK